MLFIFLIYLESYGGLGNETLSVSSKYVLQVASFWFQFFSPLSKAKDEAQNGSFELVNNQNNFRYFAFTSIFFGYM